MPLDLLAIGDEEGQRRQADDGQNQSGDDPAQDAILSLDAASRQRC